MSTHRHTARTLPGVSGCEGRCAPLKSGTRQGPPPLLPPPSPHAHLLGAPPSVSHPPRASRVSTQPLEPAGLGACWQPMGKAVKLGCLGFRSLFLPPPSPPLAHIGIGGGKAKGREEGREEREKSQVDTKDVKFSLRKNCSAIKLGRPFSSRLGDSSHLRG